MRRARAEPAAATVEPVVTGPAAGDLVWLFDLRRGRREHLARVDARRGDMLDVTLLNDFRETLKDVPRTSSERVQLSWAPMKG